MGLPDMLATIQHVVIPHSHENMQLRYMPTTTQPDVSTKKTEDVGLQHVPTSTPPESISESSSSEGLLDIHTTNTPDHIENGIAGNGMKMGLPLDLSSTLNPEVEEVSTQSTSRVTKEDVGLHRIATSTILPVAYIENATFYSETTINMATTTKIPLKAKSSADTIKQQLQSDAAVLPGHSLVTLSNTTEKNIYDSILHPENIFMTVSDCELMYTRKCEAFGISRISNKEEVFHLAVASSRCNEKVNPSLIHK